LKENKGEVKGTKGEGWEEKEIRPLKKSWTYHQL